MKKYLLLSLIIPTLASAQANFGFFDRIELRNMQTTAAAKAPALAKGEVSATPISVFMRVTDDATVARLEAAGATDSGENKTGTIERLYPLKAYSLDYDLDVMQTAGGKFIISQWQPFYFQTVASVGATAYKGVPINIYDYPESGMRFKSVTVNGKEIYAKNFIITEPSTIKVNFTRPSRAHASPSPTARSSRSW